MKVADMLHQRTGVVADLLATIPDTLDDEARDYLQHFAAMIPWLIVHRGTLEVAARIEREALDDLQALFLWSLLDSKTRAAIKRAKGQTPEMR